jgi:hypothetical protein
VCAAGDAEEVRLEGAGARAAVTCAADSGSTTVRAFAAFPYIELRKTIGGFTTILELAPGQAATLGSPAVADPENTEPVRIRLVNQSGQPVGTFDLDPGESAEATQSSTGLLTVTVFSGAVDVTVGEETVTLGVGETRGFEVCSPLEVEGVVASPAVLWPPNNKMVTVTLSPVLAGSCGTATCRVVSVTSNEPSPARKGHGAKNADWAFDADGLTLKLRAERLGKGQGRVYTILVACTDEAGNTVTKTASVSVPHQR